MISRASAWVSKRMSSSVAVDCGSATTRHGLSSLSPRIDAVFIAADSSPCTFLMVLAERPFRCIS